MKLQKSLLIAVALCLLGSTLWELYWRNQGAVPDIQGNDDLWAVQRARLERPETIQTVLIGSSRIMFDLQLDTWEAETGIRPVQLGIEGSSPLPVLRDIVEHSGYRGLLMVGISPGLFFSTTQPKAPPWEWAQSKVDHYHKRTWADRTNHLISIPFQQHLAFMSENEGVDAQNLRGLLEKVSWGQRVYDPFPPFPSFGTYTIERNIRMTDRTAKDTAFANIIKRVWTFFGDEERSPDREATTAFFKQYATQYIEEGGEIILVWFPSSGELRHLEDSIFTKELYWKPLLEIPGITGVLSAEHPHLDRYECPEWSHLSAEDADTFTRDLARLLVQKGRLTAIHKSKTP